MGRIQSTNPTVASNFQSIEENATAPFYDAQGYALAGYGYLPPLQPRIEPAHQGLGPGRGFIFDGYPNRTWSLRATNNLIVRTAKGVIRGFSYSGNLNTPTIPYAVSNGFAGKAPSTGIYTGVGDEDC